MIAALYIVFFPGILKYLPENLPGKSERFK